MGNFFTQIKDFLRFSSSRGSATLTGALVFYILLGIIPISYVSSLILSIMGTELTVVINTLSTPFFSDVTDYIISTAHKLGAGGNVLVFFVALYSSANIFYHLRLSGVMLYNYPLKYSFILRIISIVATFIVICTFSIGATLYISLVPKINYFAGQKLSTVINFAVVLLAVLVLAVLVNFYACPFKLKFREVIKGSAYTSLFCFIATFCFFIYVNNFSSLDALYGKIAIIVIFLSWLYLMVKGFIDGITLNVFLMTRRKKQKNDKPIKNVLKPLSS